MCVRVCVQLFMRVCMHVCLCFSGGLASLCVCACVCACACACVCVCSVYACVFVLGGGLASVCVCVWLGYVSVSIESALKCCGYDIFECVRMRVCMRVSALRLYVSSLY